MRTLISRSVGAALGAVALTVSLALVSDPSGASGVIDTTNAFIVAADSNGSVTIDPCAPVVALPDLPDLGTMPGQDGFSGALPGLPSTGSGSMGAFATNSDMNLAGGTSEYTSYTITDAASVTYTGAVTILVTGDVSITGRIDSGDAITIVAGGAIEIIGLDGAPETGIHAFSSGSFVSLEAGTRIGIGAMVASDGVASETQSEVVSEFADVTIRAHGTTSSGDRGLDIAQSRIRSGAGAVTLAAADFATWTAAMSMRPSAD